MTLVLHGPSGWRGCVWRWKHRHARLLRRLGVWHPATTGALFNPEHCEFDGDEDDFVAELMEHMSRPVERRR